MHTYIYALPLALVLVTQELFAVSMGNRPEDI